MVKIFQAKISIDENGMHFKSFGLKHITLNHRNIKSITTGKPTKPSNIVMAAMLMVLAALLAYLVISWEWEVILPIAALLPGSLLMIYKQDQKCHDPDTQLYIEYENKKWYELTAYYSIVTNRMTASGIQAAIEYHREAH
ncbi:MAG: hypothetical protein ACT6FC_04025 [Methanosarcinaceae archaeon]